MAITGEEFNRVIDEWKGWQSYPWGKLFYSTERYNLSHHLPKKTDGQSLRVLDVGGGNGADSLYFAGQGYQVTLLDYSTAMLDEARKAAEAQGLSGQITFCQADASTVADCFPGQTFDLILCNLMIEFVPDPFALLRALPDLLAPGGLISLVEGNRYSEPYRKIFMAGDLSAATQAIDIREYPHPWFGRSVPMFSAQELIDVFTATGCALEGQYGLLCVCPWLPNEPKYDPRYFAELEQLERAMTSTYPYFLLARFFQIIVRRHLS